MSSFPRRSARLSPQLAQEPTQTRGFSSSSVPTMSQFSQTSSASTTSHPSPNNSLNPPPPPPTPMNAQSRLQIQPTFMSYQSNQIHPPLPSPSAGEMDPFFGRPQSQPNPYNSSHPQGFVPQQSQQQQGMQQQNQEQPQQLHPHTNSISQAQGQGLPQMNPGQLPPDFLAEAAKRAQMACLMRDLGDVSL